MCVRNWGDSEDGLYELVSVSPATVEGGMHVMRKSFFVHEKACIGVELQKHPEAAVELEELCLRAVRDGVSLVAVEKSTQKIVGVAFNKLQVKSDGQQTYFEQYAANCKYESSRGLVQFMNDADAVVDLFDLTKSRCLLELMFVAVLPEFRQKGLARKLFEKSIEIAKALYAGENVKVPIDDQPLSIEPVPTIVSGIMTSTITQKLAKALGFVKVVDISYERFVFKGKTFASRIGPDTPYTTIEYITLN